MVFKWIRNKLGAYSTGNDWTADEIPDLAGKVAVVTGGSAGIGCETARQLYAHGAKVYLACRDESKAVAAINSIERSCAAETPHGLGSLEYIHFDLTDLKSCKMAAQRLIEKEQRLDIVVANAGIMGYPFHLINGIECQFYNHLGHYAFITALLPLLRLSAASNSASAASVRLVIVSSSCSSNSLIAIPHVQPDSSPAHKWSPLPDFTVLKFSETPSGLGSTFARYGLSKLCNLLHVSSLSRDPLNSQLSILAVHPGPVASTISRGLVVSYPWTGPLNPPAAFFLLTVPEGAQTSLYAATSPNVDSDRLSGKYLVPYARVEIPSEMARDEELADQLEELSERLCRDV